MSHTDYEFEVAKVFPAGDPIAIDLLRLMASANDLTSLQESFNNDFKQVSSGTQQIGHLLCQIRLIVSILHEALVVIEHMRRNRKEFDILLNQFTDEGKAVFLKLRRVAEGKDPRTAPFLRLTRNRLTFHYDVDEFRLALSAIQTRNNSQKDSFIVNEELRTYYPLADRVRTVGWSRLRGSTSEAMDAVLGLRRDLRIFIHCAFTAYVEDRKLQGHFDKVIHDRLETKHDARERMGKAEPKGETP